MVPHDPGGIIPGGGEHRYQVRPGHTFAGVAQHTGSKSNWKIVDANLQRCKRKEKYFRDPLYYKQFRRQQPNQTETSDPGPNK